MSLSNPQPAGDIVQEEFENNAKAVRVIIVDETGELFFKDLIKTIQELSTRLTVLSAVKGINESLRVTPLSSVSTAVTGPLTNAQLVAENNRLNNLTVTIANINNTIGS